MGCSDKMPINANNALCCLGDNGCFSPPQGIEAGSHKAKIYFAGSSKFSVKEIEVYKI